MEMKDLVGKKVIAANGLWEGENDGDGADITFEDGTKLFFGYSAFSTNLSINIEPHVEDSKET